MALAVSCLQVPVAPAAETDEEAAVSAFYAGLAAMKMGLLERARNDLQQASERLPDEPAVWADLGVLAMRRGDDATAREHLEHARSLATNNADIALLLGLLERRAGNTTAAIESFRRAGKLEPQALKPRYALLTALEERGAGSSREARRLIAGLLRDDPDNPVLRLDQVRLLADSGDGEALAAAIERLAPLARSWPAAAQEQLAALRQAAGEPERAAVAVTVLRNVLLRAPAFRDGLARLQSPAHIGGEPLERFVRTPVPASKPALPDHELSYEARSLEAGTATDTGVMLLPVAGPGAVVNAARTAVPAGIDVPAPDIDEPLGTSQSLAVDLRNNGSADIVTATALGFRLYRQQANEGFAELNSGLAPDVKEAAYSGVWAADMELDGDMDLVLGIEEGPPTVLQNNGDGTFTERALLEQLDGLRDFVWADLDGDGLPDVAALDAAGRVHRFHNARAWSYEPVEAVPGQYVAIAAADLSWDGRMELVALTADGALMARDGDTPVESRGQWPGMPAALQPGQADLRAADLDNNGAVDLLASAADRTVVWLTDDRGRQQRLNASMPWRVAVIKDLTGDGLLDLVGRAPDGGMIQLAATGQRAYGWQAIRPRALENAGDNRINTFALGGQVEIRAGLLVQRQMVGGPVVHFGLGEQDRADVAWILWPNGTSQAEFDLQPRRMVEAVQRLKGSCPWVFAHDGRGLRFITDFLWRSPLGMRVNAVDTATITQTEDRVRIPGEALAVVDGRYEIRITAELWETHFIDAISLLAVDHAPTTSMFVDERFSRAKPDLSPVLTGAPQPVAAVVDDRGRDWTDAARELDQRYVAGLELGRYQGITRPHYVEIDLGDAGRGKAPVLLASGWVYPTDSSINVAIAQGPEEEARPHDLRLEVADAENHWEVVRTGLGFPAGKHKTMLIDLQGVFQPGAPRRLRLATNLEIYWDRLAVAERRPEATNDRRRLAVDTAILRYRGFSETSRRSRRKPEVPHYERLQGTGQRWPDLTGYHTRFGDVRELLAAPDDRYVIMNAGDELVLRFEAPPRRAGRRRDFILVGHGWVKDGDYNTAFSRTVLPLPSRDRPAYDAPLTTLEEDPVYQRHAGDWRRFHTRYVSPSRFLSGLRDP